MKNFFSAQGLVRIASSVKTTHPEAARALEESWQKRRQELAGWQPSRGWLADVQSPNGQMTSDASSSSSR